MTTPSIILASLLDIVRLSVEIADVYERSSRGEIVTDQEWNDLKTRLADAESKWDQA